MSAYSHSKGANPNSVKSKTNKIISKIRSSISSSEWTESAASHSLGFMGVASFEELKTTNRSDYSKLSITPIAEEVRGLIFSAMMEFGKQLSMGYISTIHEPWRREITLLLASYKPEDHEECRDEILHGVVDALERVLGYALSKIEATEKYLSDETSVGDSWS
jgi:hypothetical protein